MPYEKTDTTLEDQITACMPEGKVLEEIAERQSRPLDDVCDQPTGGKSTFWGFGSLRPKEPVSG